MTVEGFLRGVVAGLLVFVAASGICTFFWATPPPVVQVLQLAHLIAGLGLFFAGIAYMIVHIAATVRTLSLAARSMPRAAVFAVVGLFVYTIGFVFVNPGREGRAIGNPVIGVGSLITLGLVLVSGFRIARGAEGRTPVVGAVALLTAFISALAGAGVAAGFMLYNHGFDSPRAAHAILAPIAIGLIAWHIRGARRTSAGRSARAYAWARPLMWVSLPVFALCTVAVAVAATGVLKRVHPSAVDAHLLVPMDADFAQRIPAACAECHPEPTAGWQASSHHRAADNPVFTALVRRLADDRGPAAVRVCLGCHAPHAPDPLTTPIAAVLASAGYANGVHCVSCHRTTPGAGHGDGSLLATPLSGDPFWFLTDRLSATETPDVFQKALISSRVGLHRSVFSTKPQAARVCLPCHVQTLAAMTDGRMTLAIQDQYDSWAASSFAASGQNCVSCHMPRFVSDDSYLVVDHRLRAASTYVAGVAAGAKGVEEVISSLHGGSSLPPPVFEDPPRPVPAPLLTLQVSRKRVDDRDVLVVTTRNNGRIGHSFPNGPTDLIQAWLALRVTNGAGDVVMDLGRDGPDEALRLGDAFEDSEARPIHDHRLWAIERVVDHGRIPPDGSYEQQVPLPAAVAGPVSVEGAWRYRRLDPAVAAALGETRTWMLPIVDLVTFRIDNLTEQDAASIVGQDHLRDQSRPNVSG